MNNLVFWASAFVGVLFLAVIAYLVGVAAWGTFGDWKRHRKRNG